ncbi:MAG: hypothetical protein ABR548_10475 [Actinomycetota bacterium]|nr:hypothetical protein [Actinomycetota bacterium]
MGVGTAETDWRVEEAVFIAGLRTRNDWIEATLDALGDASTTNEYVCECGDPACPQLLRTTRAEYEGVRSVATRFIVATDHEDPETDVLREENERFSVVEKMPGRLSRVANESDVRGRGETSR